MRPVFDTYAVVKLDVLLFALEGLSEPRPTRREVERERLARLWSYDLTTQEIGDLMGLKANNVRVRAMKMGLPKRKTGPRPKCWNGRRFAA